MKQRVEKRSLRMCERGGSSESRLYERLSNSGRILLLSGLLTLIVTEFRGNSSEDNVYSDSSMWA